MNIRTIELQAKLPFPAGRGQLWYIVPEGYTDISVDEKGRWAEMRRRFARQGYKLHIVNEISDGLTLDMLKYNVPDAESFAGALRHGALQSRFERALGYDISCPTFISSEEDSLYGRPSVTLYEFPDCGSCAAFGERFLEEMCPLGTDIFIEKDYFESRHIDEEQLVKLRRPEVKKAPMAPKPKREKTEEEMIDDIISKLSKANDKQLRDLGIDAEALEFLLGMAQQTLSRMRITRSAKIILEDYGGMEIKLDTKTKALYFLFLRHPEGLCIKDLPDHYDELLDLYRSISGRDDPAAMGRTIAALCDPYGADANISLSRIKKAFVEAFREDLAKAYYVSGKRGEMRRITLDRGLVTWETIRP